jgi:hypothetical protein
LLKQRKFAIAKFWLALVVVMVPAVVGSKLSAQGQPQDQGPLPARSRAEQTLEMWSAIGNKLIVMAGDFPEDKYDFPLQNDRRTFAENLLHVAARTTT